MINEMEACLCAYRAEKEAEIEVFQGKTQRQGSCAETAQEGREGDRS